QNFGPDAIPSFLNNDGTEDTTLEMSNVTVVDSKQIKTDLFVQPGAALGSRILKVKSGNKESQLANALQVVEISLDYSQGAKTTVDDDRVANHPTVVRAFVQSPDPI